MTPDTNTESLFETLLAEGVLEEADDEAVQLTETFRDARSERRDSLVGDDVEEFERVAREFLEDTDVAVDDVDRSLLVDAMAARDVAASLDRETSLQVADALDRIEETMERSGVPTGFVSVPGEEIDAFIERHPGSILYFWREDCEPCDEIRADFEDLVREDEIPDQFGLGAVYGPDCPIEVRQEYEVAVAPTTLFCEGGRVAARLVGYPGTDSITNEIRILESDVLEG